MPDLKARPFTVLMLFARTFATAIALVGCVGLPSYPSHWAPVAKSEGPCPNISGIYANTGGSSAKDAPTRDLLSFLSRQRDFLLGEAVERISIAQTSADISVEVLNGEDRLARWRFRLVSGSNYSASFDQAICRPEFVGIVLMSGGSAQLEAPVTHFVVAEEARFQKASDGALIVQRVHSDVAMIVIPSFFLPYRAGQVQLYRFPPAAAPADLPSNP